MANLFIRTSMAPYRIDMYNALHEQLGMRMCFYSRIPGDQPFDPDWMESLCRFTPTYLKGIRFGKSESRKVCFGVWRLLRREKPELVIIPEFQFVLHQARLFRFFSRRKFRIVSMCDDSMDMIAGNDFSGVHGKLRKWAPRHLDGMITVTPEVRDWYAARFPGLPVFWLPIIGDAAKVRERYAGLLRDSQSLEQSHGLVRKKVILFVGRLVALKQVDLLIRAHASIPDTVLVIVGDGPERDALEQIAAPDQQVLFTGRLEGDALYSWYNVGDVLCLPSRQEAFGAVTGEALQAGCRVVVSSRAGSSCLVTSRNGEVTDPSDEDALALSLARQLALAAPRGETLRPNLLEVTLEERIYEIACHYAH